MEVLHINTVSCQVALIALCQRCSQLFSGQREHLSVICLELRIHQRHSEIQMVGTVAVKAFVWKKKMDEKINLLVCYFFNDTVYVDCVNSDLADATPPLA